MEYEEGQIVMCIENPNAKHTSSKGAGWREGLKFKITRISKNSTPINTVIWGAQNTNGVYPEYLRHQSWQDRYRGIEK